MNILKSIIGIMLFFPMIAIAQNVGVGTTNPTEKLDVNGNLNVQGQIKMGGVQGSAGQVLMKNMDNNPIWSSISSEFDTLAVFNHLQFDYVQNPTTLIVNWTVPAGVTKVFIELWGAGGGAGINSGGASGAYVSGFIKTIPGTIIPLTIGAGGTSASLSVNAEAGGYTNFTNFYNSQYMFAGGGEGASLGAAASGTINLSLPQGGYYQSTGVPTAFGLRGKAANKTKYNNGIVNATTYFEQINYADGADSPLFPNSAPAGGSRRTLIPGGTINYFGEYVGSAPGFGASSTHGYGYTGGNGCAIIRWKK